MDNKNGSDKTILYHYHFKLIFYYRYYLNIKQK